jgi:transcriptional regulator with XRE-family HTH domain
MTARNVLVTTPPYPVEQTIKHLGANLRTARLRRNLSIEQVAEKIGAGTRAIRAAEQGKVSTGIGVYIALLWAYDLLDPAMGLADPGKDDTGLACLEEKERKRARNMNLLDNDF